MPTLLYLLFVLYLLCSIEVVGLRVEVVEALRAEHVPGVTAGGKNSCMRGIRTRGVVSVPERMRRVEAMWR